MAQSPKTVIKHIIEIMGKEHTYNVEVEWTGNRGEGTKNYQTYSRDHEAHTSSAPTILGSADPHFLGDPQRWNPEQLLLAAVANCHMLTYLSDAARKKITVIDYTDNATGTMVENNNGGGNFTEITLYPRVVISSDSDPTLATELHHTAHQSCYIAASVNFPIHHKPQIIIDTSA